MTKFIGRAGWFQLASCVGRSLGLGVIYVCGLRAVSTAVERRLEKIPLPQLPHILDGGASERMAVSDVSDLLSLKSSNIPETVFSLLNGL